MYLSTHTHTVWTKKYDLLYIERRRSHCWTINCRIWSILFVTCSYISRIQSTSIEMMHIRWIWRLRYFHSNSTDAVIGDVLLLLLILGTPRMEWYGSMCVCDWTTWKFWLISLKMPFVLICLHVCKWQILDFITPTLAAQSISPSFSCSKRPSSKCEKHRAILMAWN